MKICLDPGHGGTERGARSPWLGDEAAYVLDFSRAVESVLTACGHTVTRTRSTDEARWLNPRSWGQRRERAKGSDLVLSLHFDSAEDPNLHGLTTYYWPGNDWGMRVSRKIASAAPAGLLRQGKAAYAVQHDDPTTGRAYHVVKAYHPTTVLIELGYGSNEIDAGLLVRKNIQHGIIGAILAGVSSTRRPSQAIW